MAVRFTPPADFVEAIRAAGSLVLMTHRGPDGDGLGTELALARALRRVGKRVTIVNEDRTPPRFRFLDRARDAKVYRRPLARAVREADLALLVDTSDVPRAGTAAELRRKSGGPFLAMDHHPPSPTALPGFVEAGAASTAELAWDLLQTLDLPVDAETATALYAGIAFDTNSFRFIRNESWPLRIAAELIEQGADAERVQAELFSHPRDWLSLLGRILDGLQFEADGRVALLALTTAHLEGLELDADDISEVVTLLNTIRGVDACAFIRQNGPRAWRVNLRSRAGHAIDGLARAYGGGGHPRASGATVREMDLEDVLRVFGESLAAIVTGRPLPEPPSPALPSPADPSPAGPSPVGPSPVGPSKNRGDESPPAPGALDSPDASGAPDRPE